MHACTTLTDSIIAARSRHARYWKANAEHIIGIIIPTPSFITCQPNSSSPTACQCCRIQSAHQHGRSTWVLSPCPNLPFHDKVTTEWTRLDAPDILFQIDIRAETGVEQNQRAEKSAGTAISAALGGYCPGCSLFWLWVLWIRRPISRSNRYLDFSPPPFYTALIYSLASFAYFLTLKVDRSSGISVFGSSFWKAVQNYNQSWNTLAQRWFNGEFGNVREYTSNHSRNRKTTTDHCKLHFIARWFRQKDAQRWSCADFSTRIWPFTWYLDNWLHEKMNTLLIKYCSVERLLLPHPLKLPLVKKKTSSLSSGCAKITIGTNMPITA